MSWDPNGDGGGGTAIQVIEAGALQAISKAEIDMQIATAKKYPRNLSRVVAGAKELACFSLDTAESCFYRLQRSGKLIEGPSIRMAEIVLNMWGNLRAGCRVIDVGDRTITAQGVVHDLETNVLITREVQRRITNKKGERFNDDMIVVTGNAACSIALRNATFSVIPRALVREISQHIDAKLEAGDFGSVEQLRDRIIVRFAEHGVTEDELAKHLGRRGLKGITMVDVMTLRKTFATLDTGVATAGQIFRGESMDEPSGHEEPGDTRTASERMADNLAGNGSSNGGNGNGAHGNGGGEHRERKPHPITGMKSHRGPAGEIVKLLDDGAVPASEFRRICLEFGGNNLDAIDAGDYQAVLDQMRSVQGPPPGETDADESADVGEGADA